MKKITKPAPKPSAPASKVSKPAKSVVSKPAPAAPKKAALAAKAVKSTQLKAPKTAPVDAFVNELVPVVVKPAQAPKVVKSPALKADPAPVALVTTIIATVDVGFGNVLTLRGEGAGLSWETGLPMNCAAADRWTISLPAANTPLVFKFLINDAVWSGGDNYTLTAGTEALFSPAF